MSESTFCVDGPPMDILRVAGAPAGRITRALRLLTLAVVVVPVILLATAAWINFDAAFRDARERVHRVRDAIQEFPRNAFEGDALIPGPTGEHVARSGRP